MAAAAQAAGGHNFVTENWTSFCRLKSLYYKVYLPHSTMTHRISFNFKQDQPQPIVITLWSFPSTLATLWSVLPPHPVVRCAPPSYANAVKCVLQKLQELVFPLLHLVLCVILSLPPKNAEICASAPPPKNAGMCFSPSLLRTLKYVTPLPLRALEYVLLTLPYEHWKMWFPLPLRMLEYVLLPLPHMNTGTCGACLSPSIVWRVPLLSIVRCEAGPSPTLPEASCQWLAARDASGSAIIGTNARKFSLIIVARKFSIIVATASKIKISAIIASTAKKISIIATVRKIFAVNMQSHTMN